MRQSSQRVAQPILGGLELTDPMSHFRHHLAVELGIAGRFDCDLGDCTADTGIGWRSRGEQSRCPRGLGPAVEPFGDRAGRLHVQMYGLAAAAAGPGDLYFHVPIDDAGGGADLKVTELPGGL